MLFIVQIIYIVMVTSLTPLCYCRISIELPDRCSYVSEAEIRIMNPGLMFKKFTGQESNLLIVPF